MKKKWILTVLLNFIILVSQAQSQSEYSGYLENALEAAKKGDERRFQTNLRYFSAALQRSHITPQSLNTRNQELYRDAIYEGRKFELSPAQYKQLLAFLKYDLDNPANMTSLGVLYHHGKGVEKDYAEAARLYRKAAELGYANGQNQLGAMYSDGDGVAQDDAEAVRWFRKAAEQNHPRGQANMGFSYRSGRGVSQNYQEAIRWFRKAAEQGDDYSMDHLGDMYYNGYGVVKDYAEALRWYRQAAEQGNNRSQLSIGFSYANGHGVAKDDAEAVHWYRKAAENGNAAGENNLGWRYYRGQGVEESDEQARHWFEKAAAKGNAEAMYGLGHIYDNGHGVDINWQHAVGWYEKASEAGNTAAKVALGEFYVFGVGGKTQNIPYAEKLFSEAEKEGSEIAGSYLQVLKDARESLYHILNRSSGGNRIYLSEETKKKMPQFFPFTAGKFGVGLKLDVQYSKSAASEGVRIFPMIDTMMEKPLPSDRLSFSTYSPSGFMQEKEGKHEIWVNWKEKRGNRAINYLYIIGYFSGDNKENLRIKIPVVICWKPERDYGN